ncbi:MAG: hypothetical protein OXH84_03420 [Gammaproteobacteria bacterium]|nr:hypothetical protein [Gammaproteobacteria bacterium]
MVDILKDCEPFAIEAVKRFTSHMSSHRTAKNFTGFRNKFASRGFSGDNFPLHKVNSKAFIELRNPRAAEGKVPNCKIENRILRTDPDRYSSFMLSNATAVPVDRSRSITETETETDSETWAVKSATEFELGFKSGGETSGYEVSTTLKTSFEAAYDRAHTETTERSFEDKGEYNFTLPPFAAVEVQRVADIIRLERRITFTAALDFDVRIWSHHDWDCVWEGGIDGYISGLKGIREPKKVSGREGKAVGQDFVYKDHGQGEGHVKDVFKKHPYQDRWLKWLRNYPVSTVTNVQEYTNARNVKYTFAYIDDPKVDELRRKYLRSIASDRAALQALIDLYPDVGVIPDPDKFRCSYEPAEVTENMEQVRAVFSPHLPDGTSYQWQYRYTSKKSEVHDEQNRLGARTNILRDLAHLHGKADIRIAYKLPLSGWGYGPWITVGK